MVEINLLPQQYRKQSAPDAWKYGSVAAVAVTLAAMGVMWGLTSQNVRQLQGQIDSVQGDITALTPQKQKYDELVTQQQNLEKVTSVAQTLKGTKTYWSNDLAVFSREIPASSGVALTKLTMRDKKPEELTTDQGNGIFIGKAVRRELDLSGAASSQQAVINFLNTFENSPGFGVNFQGMERDDKSGAYTFNARVGIVGDSPAATATPAAPGAAPGTAATAPAPAAPAAPAGGTNGN
ncbi:fimbrial assembly protein [Deinococcus cavernae]|uniref:Fimbrial assembly protein n=1 Tax=Deinococcus cavernae TaxID=2320857 RepID=A0A418VAX1_9DEIO|nr:fimbrial assembly protein [Deinococcus cavernae]RJF73253.1 fimbrial assembly protein [Deinococcus cavernae]